MCLEAFEMLFASEFRAPYKSLIPVLNFTTGAAYIQQLIFHTFNTINHPCRTTIDWFLILCVGINSTHYFLSMDSIFTDRTAVFSAFEETSMSKPGIFSLLLTWLGDNKDLNIAGLQVENLHPFVMISLRTSSRDNMGSISKVQTSLGWPMPHQTR